jgi:hypothetical protein
MSDRPPLTVHIAGGACGADRLVNQGMEEAYRPAAPEDRSHV